MPHMKSSQKKSFLTKAAVKMGNHPTYSGECNLKEFENWVESVLQFMLLYNLLDLKQVERFDQEIKHWDLESVRMGLQKWFMLTLSLNKVAVNYDTIMQGSMTVQQLHQELLKLAKQMIELPDAYSYSRRFMSVIKPDIREQVLKKGFTPEFSSIDELVDEADRRVAEARIDKVILEESDEGAPHPEEPQDWEDQPEEDDQQYCFDDDEYKTRSIDNEVVRVNAAIKDSGYNDHHRLYGIRVQEEETDLRVSAVVQTGGKEQPVYDH
ncbi:hypothetical protein M422DRAFT_247166 [Sphaerobolus stellatus SS14]|nr:hypothetical protein M422DRAFT_247166 [Sphaerobolus stellatus SS14]